MICPVCHGSKLRFNEGTNSWGPESCVACSGTGEGPEGCRITEETRAKMDAALHAPGRNHGNQHVPWLPEEDTFALAADKAWRRKKQSRRPKGWYEDVAARMHKAFPDQPLRSKQAVKQRILRLALATEE